MALRINFRRPASLNNFAIARAFSNTFLSVFFSALNFFPRKSLSRSCISKPPRVRSYLQIRNSSDLTMKLVFKKRSWIIFDQSESKRINEIDSIKMTSNYCLLFNDENLSSRWLADYSICDEFGSNWLVNNRFLPVKCKQMNILHVGTKKSHSLFFKHLTREFKKTIRIKF